MRRALEEGQTTITAQLGAFSDTAELTVTGAVLTRLQVSPPVSLSVRWAA